MTQQKVPKYKIENSIHMGMNFMRVLTPDDLDNPEIRAKLDRELCHIYMICSRPRIIIDKEYTKIDEEKINFAFSVTDRDNKYPLIIQADNDGVVHLNSEFPYTEYQLLDSEGVPVSEGKVSYFLTKMLDDRNLTSPFLDMKVLYVGQAFGEGGERLAAVRLSSHSTLQKILSDMNTKNPTSEVYIILLKFEPYIMSAGGAGFEDALLGNEETQEHLEKVLSTPLDSDQEITLTEAALIRYFEPIYNKEYKTTFPQKSHASYGQCYQLDLNSVGFTLKVLGKTRLFSDSVPANNIHNKTFPLNTESYREDMYKIVMN